MKERLILASKSPRRIEMLSKYGAIDILSPDLEEKISCALSVEETVMSLALKKALCVLESYQPRHSIILSADTVVFYKGILGKPIDKEDARKMLIKLSGKAHEVYTGYALVHSESRKKVIDFEKTQVVFNEIGEDIIDRYLDKNEFHDKAGAYAIQGFGELLVKEIIGSYSNVVGLPISSINKHLKSNFDYNLI
ncbi:MAG: septum formation protein Maf [Tissierellales bacterium]|nr:septum formation protein Maf [Tissierellales bacterium]MBN2827851.1 septum formation protein Maf [Tissierellales bacterium]